MIKSGVFEERIRGNFDSEANLFRMLNTQKRIFGCSQRSKYILRSEPFNGLVQPKE